MESDCFYFHFRQKKDSLNNFVVIAGKKAYLPFIKSHSNLPSKQRPFSFSRIQLLWWTIIICTCAILIFAQKTNTSFANVFNQSSLILLGISLGTTTTARIIDNSDVNNVSVARHQDNRTSKGFILDILSDANGLSLHRFQTVIFNIIFGAVFLINFFDSGMTTLQNFGSMELGLMGISSGGYLALKINENQTYQPALDANSIQNQGQPVPQTQATVGPPPSPPVTTPAPTQQQPPPTS